MSEKIVRVRIITEDNEGRRRVYEIEKDDIKRFNSARLSPRDKVVNSGFFSEDDKFGWQEL